MKNIPSVIDGIEFKVNGCVKVSSVEIAESFDKRHSDIIRAIENLEQSESFTERNYALSEYKDRSGKLNKSYLMTRDGFSCLVMKFTGKKAAIWRERFLDAFNAMERHIVNEIARKDADNSAKLECPAMTLALKETRAEIGKATKPFHYSNEHNLIYRIVLGATKKKWCEAEDIDLKDRLRDHLPSPMIQAVEELQRVNTSMIEMGFTYDVRKAKLGVLYEKKYAQRCLDEIVKINA